MSRHNNNVGFNGNMEEKQRDGQWSMVNGQGDKKQIRYSMVRQSSTVLGQVQHRIFGNGSMGNMGNKNIMMVIEATSQIDCDATGSCLSTLLLLLLLFFPLLCTHTTG